MPHILITADIHLQANEQHPINQKFYSFLNTLAPKAKAVYLIGDVFEMWQGDDIGFKGSKSFFVNKFQVDEILRLFLSYVALLRFVE